MLIGILGRRGVGKDTVSDYLEEKYQFNKKSFATPLKEICKLLFNFTDDQLYGNLKDEIDPRWKTSPRVIMQYLGTDVFRKDINKIMPQMKDDFWVNIALTNKSLESNVVIADVRFANEIEHIHKRGGKIIKIIRPNGSNDAHESEINIDSINSYDFLIINDGTINELFNQVDQIMQNI